MPTWAKDSDLLDLSKKYTKKYYMNGQIGSVIQTNMSGTTVQQESAFDVNKRYSIVYTFKDETTKEDTTRTFFSPVANPLYYTAYGKNIYYAYRPVIYESSEGTVTRFYNDGGIAIGSNETVPVITELPTVESYLNGRGITKTASYDKNTDTSSIVFACTDNKLADEKDIQYGFLELYNESGAQVLRQDVRKKFNYTVSSLPTGVYTAKIIFSSLKTANMDSSGASTIDKITKTLGKIEAYVPTTDAISAEASSKKYSDDSSYF